MISVCIPMYNAEQYIQETLKSVIAQTYRDIEIIVIDNCSTDDSVRKVKEIADSRIRIIRNTENVGLVNNWNLCFINANGEYINILCADDLLETTCLEKKAAALERYSNAGAVFSASSVIDEDGRIILRRRPLKGDQLLKGRNFAPKAFERKNCFGEPSNVLFRKKVTDKVGRYKDHIVSVLDWEYMLRVCEEADIFYIDEYLSKFRISVTSTTGNIVNNKKMLLEEDALFMNMYREKFSKWILAKHKLFVRIRIYAKILFFKLKRKRRG